VNSAPSQSHGETRPAPARWVARPQTKNIVVGIADMAVSNDSGADLVTYSLGSCLGVAVYDPVVHVGGLLHLMLPDSTLNAGRAEARPFAFVDTGIPRLFHAIYGLGGVKERLRVRVAGGAQFLDANKFFNIGKRNIAATREILARNGVNLTVEDVGGSASRTMRLHLADGAVSIDTPGKPNYFL